MCLVRRNAILRFEEVPTAPTQLKQFDEQMRALYAAPGIAEAIDAETARGPEICALLAKGEWTAADRVTLLDVIEDLYEYT